eukprot:CAMPEP_0113699838 /NCGR_PEP_ID=MMETSP0038_2-20120614/23580_1 /TAXON_ID=2898 /ORGANISM="Cryptomonas paramecium" /LENGTH=234 /DNA_ID=CAMNT_0000623341 /DNA_START=511 /DNA_END=1216 /DNA_ORIENTATION=- /assembly_acc=CAM_ASM_000170
MKRKHPFPSRVGGGEVSPRGREEEALHARPLPLVHDVARHAQGVGSVLGQVEWVRGAEEHVARNAARVEVAREQHIVGEEARRRGRGREEVVGGEVAAPVHDALAALEPAVAPTTGGAKGNFQAWSEFLTSHHSRLEDTVEWRNAIRADASSQLLPTAPVGTRSIWLRSRSAMLRSEYMVSSSTVTMHDCGSDSTGRLRSSLEAGPRSTPSSCMNSRTFGMEDPSLYALTLPWT